MPIPPSSTRKLGAALDGQARILHFPEPTSEDHIGETFTTGKFIYNIYRTARIDQGWQEFLWESLSKEQKRVWARVTEVMSTLSEG